ncbi:MAG TPA: hypothetical protein VMT76_15095 [Puia sp.]|nr:hypothetical protein [Puia sp.]
MSLLIVIVGLIIIYKIANPLGPVSENYFVLVMVILSGFFGFLGAIALLLRFGSGKYRRKFMYSFFAVANFCIGILSVLYAIKYKTGGILALLVYVFSLLIGCVMLADIFFGKRNSKFEQEMLIY